MERGPAYHITTDRLVVRCYATEDHAAVSAGVSANLEHLSKTSSERLGMAPATDRLRITVDTPAPDVVPLPRRYVPVVEERPTPERSWWDTFIDALPGVR